MNKWKFKDQPNTAVISTKNIVQGHSSIGYVTHDADDGSWQFQELNNKELTEEDAVVVSLQNIIELDGAIDELADLPLGWKASRSSKTSPWLREKK